MTTMLSGSVRVCCVCAKKKFIPLTPIPFLTGALIAAAASALPPERAGQAVVIEGLTLPCANCTVTPQGACEVQIAEERFLLPCPVAAERLLEAAAQGYDGRHPSPKELLSYLERQSSSAEALALLLQSEEGRELFLSSLYAQEKVIRTALFEVLEQKKVPDTFLRELWRRASQSRELFPLQTLARIAASASWGEVVPALPLDARRSAEVLSAVAGQKPVWAERAQRTADLLMACLRASEQGGFTFSCRREDLMHLEAPEREYLLRTQVALALEIADKLPPGQALRILSEVDYENHATPLLHARLKTILASGLENDELNDALPFIHALAARDSTVARAAAQAFQRVGVERRSDPLSPPKKTWNLFALAAACSAAIVWLIARAWRPKDELESLLGSFGLSRDATAGDLQQRFHERAKRFHPDMNPGAPNAAFTRLQQRYSRARQLLEERDKS